VKATEMSGVSASNRQEHLRHAHSEPMCRSPRVRVDCLRAPRQDAADSTEPSKLFGIASAPLCCVQEDVLNSLFSFCTTSRKKKLNPPAL